MPAQQTDRDFIALQEALAGQYSLERELGRGGMGIVYLAREVQLERLVAIKVLPPQLASRPDLRARFMREARTAARLSHPNIVPIYRVDESGGFVFFVMSYVDGETLAARVRDRGPLAAHVSSKMIQEIAWALAYAHARGVIHRDIKPDNILLERETGRALVTDFGIAQVTEAHALTEAGQVMGTAHFMSPEQASGEPLDGRSDIYSLGVVAHFALTGKLPFDAATVQAILAKHLTQQPPPLAALAPAAPRALTQAIDRCLAKRPDDRHTSGEALAEAIAESSANRGELPVPLRVWLSRADPVKPLYVAWSGFFLFLATMSLIASIMGQAASPAAVTLFGFAAAPLIPLGVYRLFQTRRVLAAGYGVHDMRRALEQHVAALREEVAFDDHAPSLGGRILRVISYAALGVTGAVTGTLLLPTPPVSAGFALTTIGFSSALAAVTSILGLTYPGRRVRRRVPGEWRQRLWSSRAGEWIVRLAGVRLRRAATAPNLQRPTEVAIGMAAADLYAALPKQLQKQLADLPETVHVLEVEAQRMRRRVDEISSRLADFEAEQRSGSSTLGRFGDGSDGVASRRQSVVEELGAARDTAGRRLSMVVAALENIRLDLLRLQAGAGSTGSLTALIESARRIGGDVDEAVRGRDVVEAVLDADR